MNNNRNGASYVAANNQNRNVNRTNRNGVGIGNNHNNAPNNVGNRGANINS